MNSKNKILFALLFIFSITSVFAQNEGKMVKTLDEGKIDKLITKVKRLSKFKNYHYDENSVVLWAEELFRQYYNEKDAQVPFTEADYKASVTAQQLLKNTIERLRKDSTALAVGKEAMQAQIDAKDKELSEASKVASQLVQNNEKINTLVSVITRLRNDSTSLANKNTTLLAQIDAKDKELENTKSNASQLSECNSQKDALNGTIMRLKNDSTLLANKNESMHSQLDDYKSQIVLLNGKLKEAESKYQAYEAAFNDIKNVIDNGYNNKVLPIRRMKEDELSAAISKFEATEDLLKTNKVLYSEMKNKTDEMRTWIGLKKTLDDAAAYMTGKYNETERQRLMKEIDNSFKGLKLEKHQIDEKDAIRKALEDQFTIHENFLAIIDASRKKKALSSKVVIDEILNGLKGYYNGAQLNGRISDYHVSYHKAYNNFMNELNKGEDNPRINGPEGLSKYLDELVEIF